MTTPYDPPSVKLGAAAHGLKDKAHFARAAEKFARAAAAAAQELAAEDCLVVAFLRALQSYCLTCHFAAPGLSDAERDSMVKSSLELLPPCISTLTRRKEAGTLLAGTCRAAEVAWFRAYEFRITCGLPAVDAHAYANAVAAMVGSETYLLAAAVSTRALLFARELQLSFAAFVASALDMLASLPGEPSPFTTREEFLARMMHKLMLDETYRKGLSSFSAATLTDAWGRVERSGVLERRLLGLATKPINPSHTLGAKLAAVAEEGLARGLHTCALAGCAAKEAHVSHFKKCGACRTVAYCCREHQVEDWPSHKAACKAARKAAAPKDNA